MSVKVINIKSSVQWSVEKKIQGSKLVCFYRQTHGPGLINESRPRCNSCSHPLPDGVLDRSYALARSLPIGHSFTWRQWQGGWCNSCSHPLPGGVLDRSYTPGAFLLDTASRGGNGRGAGVIAVRTPSRMAS